MKKKEKKQLNKKFLMQIGGVIAGVIVLVLIVNFAISLANPNDGSFLTDQKVDGLLFTRTNFDNGSNTLKVMVKNTTNADYNLKSINVTYKDGANTEITTIQVYVGDVIKVGSMKQLVATTDIDISNAKTITYVINK